MILRRLVLKNYRKYRSADLEFSSGLIAVVGKNGMGKTTLFEAVAFALYGPNAARDELLGCISQFCGPDDHCELELEFSVRGEPHRLVRRIRRKGAAQHQAELFEGNNLEPVAVGPAEVEKSIRRKLGMDYLAFTRSVFSKQKEVNALSAAKPEERLKAIRRMVGIEAISRACDEVHKDQRLKQSELDGARRAIEALPDVERQAEEHQKKLDPARTAEAVARKAATTAVKEAKRAQAAFNRFDEKRGRDAALQTAVSGLEGDLRGAKREKERLKSDLDDIAKERDRLAALLPEDAKFKQAAATKEKLDKASGKHDELVRLEQESEGIRCDIAKAEAHALELAGAAGDLRQARKDDRAAVTALRRAKTKVAALQRTRGQLKQALGGPQSQCERVKKALAQIKREGSSGHCPTCYRELGDTYEEILAHLNEELAKHQADLEKAQKDLADADAELADWTAKHETAEDLVSKAAQAINAANAKQQDLRNAKKRLADVLRPARRNDARLKTLRRIDYDRTRHEEATTQYQRLERIHGQTEALRKAVGREPAVKRSLSVAVKRIASTEAALAKEETRRKAVGFDQAAYDGAKKDAERADKARRETAVALADAKGELKRIQEHLQTAQKMVKELLLQKQRIADDEEHVRYLERLEALLKDFREDLAARVKPEIEEYASVLLNQVTAGRYPRVELDENYGMSLNDGTETYPLRRFSGGEEDLANLCLRLAISQVVSSRLSGDDSSLVVLDEVFASQDEERRQGILQALVRLSETFQQVVLITHTEDINDRVPLVLRVTENAAHEAQAAWL